jgi:hypothetical protein
MKPPRTALFSATRTEQPAAGRRGIKAARRPVQASVIAQCDGCGATDDSEHRIGRERHEGCGGAYRLYGHAEVVQ